MRKIVTHFLLLVLMGISFYPYSSCFAKNVGTIGQIYSIDEMDFLDFIEMRATSMQQKGELSHLQERMQEQAKTYRDR